MVGEIIGPVDWGSTCLLNDASWILCQEGSCRCCQLATWTSQRHLQVIKLSIRHCLSAALPWTLGLLSSSKNKQIITAVFDPEQLLQSKVSVKCWVPFLETLSGLFYLLYHFNCRGHVSTLLNPDQLRCMEKKLSWLIACWNLNLLITTRDCFVIRAWDSYLQGEHR